MIKARSSTKHFVILPGDSASEFVMYYTLKHWIMLAHGKAGLDFYSVGNLLSQSQDY